MYAVGVQIPPAHAVAISSLDTPYQQHGIPSAITSTDTLHTLTPRPCTVRDAQSVVVLSSTVAILVVLCKSAGTEDATSNTYSHAVDTPPKHRVLSATDVDVEDSNTSTSDHWYTLNRSVLTSRQTATAPIHHYMVVLNTHIQPTHFLRAWICWCALAALSLYLCPLLLVRMHTYGMTSIMLHPLASHTHTPVPLAVYYVHLVLLTRLSFSVYVDTTYLYTYIVCALVYYTVHASVPHHMVSPYWYSSHVSSTQIPCYGCPYRPPYHTYTYYRIDNMSYDMSPLICSSLSHHIHDVYTHIVHILCHTHRYSTIPWYLIQVPTPLHGVQYAHMHTQVCIHIP